MDPGSLFCFEHGIVAPFLWKLKKDQRIKSKDFDVSYAKQKCLKKPLVLLHVSEQLQTADLSASDTG